MDNGHRDERHCIAMQTDYAADLPASKQIMLNIQIKMALGEQQRRQQQQQQLSLARESKHDRPVYQTVRACIRPITKGLLLTLAQ